MLIVALVFFTLSVVLAVFGLGSPNPNRGDILIAAVLMLIASNLFAVLRVGSVLEDRFKRK